MMHQYRLALCALVSTVSRLPVATGFQSRIVTTPQRASTALFVQKRGLEVRRESATPEGEKKRWKLLGVLNSNEAKGMAALFVIV